MTRRVVVTGMGGLTPIGIGWTQVSKSLKGLKSGVKRMEEWSKIEGMTSLLGAPIENFSVPDYYPRKKLRTSGRVALLGIRASEMAIEDAGLKDSELLRDGSTGVAFGSTYGSGVDTILFMKQVGVNKTLMDVNGSLFVKFMTHTCAANISSFFGIRGRVVPSCSACTSGSQGIGFGYEAIASGAQERMICGGAEELSPLGTAVFDVMYATSQANDNPTSTPRPFDKDRDGLVVGEGSAALVLESLESAQGRGARIHAEIVGFATTGDGAHMVNPSEEGMRSVMELVLKNSRIDPALIDFVSAHGTSTEIGDIAETNATAKCFKRPIPVSSIKSYMGHTLGACGAIEAWVSIGQMNEGWVAPTLNLLNVDSTMGKLDYLQQVRELQQTYVMSNNFAFGGVNTSLIFKKWSKC